MKKFNLVLLLICTPLVVFSQLKSLNLDWEDSYYRFPIKVINDTLYTASPNGLYRKDLKLDSDWELFKFKGHQIFNFVRCGDDWIATTIGEEFRTDSLILYSASMNNDEIIDITIPDILGKVRYVPLTQSPTNPKHLMVNALGTGAIYQTMDFGSNWTKLNDFFIGETEIKILESDPSVIFFYGMDMLEDGFLMRSENAGKTYSKTLYFNAYSISSIISSRTNGQLVMYAAFGHLGRSIDKGLTWQSITCQGASKRFKEFIFSDIVEDCDNSKTFYTSGILYGEQDSIYIFRSEDEGLTWEVTWKEYLQGYDVGVYRMKMHNNNLILLTSNGLFSLNVKTTPTLMESTTAKNKAVTITYDAETRAIYAETESPISAITLTDIAGRIVCSVIQQNRVNAATLSDGIYLITVQIKDGESIVQKLHIK
ncbi:MAG: T9SS type A sorting domain-containing protein [Bacteroidaceae bacterium]|nr:T9SS type A sorting domain-containing protein [Bacteroidaceae bacterium]